MKKLHLVVVFVISVTSAISSIAVGGKLNDRSQPGGARAAKVEAESASLPAIRRSIDTSSIASPSRNAHYRPLPATGSIVRPSISTRMNVFGGYDYYDGTYGRSIGDGNIGSSRPNVLGGYDYNVNGKQWSTRRNVFGGEEPTSE